MIRRKMMHIFILMVLLCSPAVAEEKGDFLRVSGNGVVSAKPDRARLLMHVSHLDRSVVAAKEVVDGNVRRVQQMLLD